MERSENSVETGTNLNSDHPADDMSAAPAGNQGNDAIDKKAEKFKLLARQRGDAVCQKLQSLSNLANPHAYHFTPEQVDIVFSTIEKQVAFAKEQFLTKPSKVKNFINL